jgi:hypothetical protein
LTENKQSYHLVHIVGGGEHKTPLVASQVFDRAQVQATTDGPGRPLSVSVWVIVPMRVAFEKESNAIISSLRKRCPDIKIEVIAGINRFNNWPGNGKINRLRNALNGKTVFHARGEMFINWSLMIKKKHPQDAIVLDIRGFYPLERFINDHHIVEVSDMTDAQKQMYFKDLQRLQYAVDHADALTTVSEPLRDYLIQQVKAGPETAVIPCCVKNTVPDNRREKVRQILNIADKTAILYLGGVHKNQYLEELGIPFIQSALSLSDKYAGVFITQNKDKMMQLITKSRLDMDRIRVISVPQNEVADYLTGMDIGLLLRAPSKQNNFSQPVKFGEYLSAGIPVVLEEGTGNIGAMLNKYQIGYVVKLTDKSRQSDFDAEVKKALDWYQEHKNEVRTNTKNFVDDCYTWKANVQNERNIYIQALQKVMKNKLPE